MKKRLARLGEYLVRKYSDKGLDYLIKGDLGMARGHSKIDTMDKELKERFLLDAFTLSKNETLQLITEYAIIEQRDETFASEDGSLELGKAAVYGITRPLRIAQEFANLHTAVEEDKEAEAEVDPNDPS